MTLQDRYDDAMFAYSQGDYAAAQTGLRAVLAEDAAHFDAQLSLAMCLYRQGDFPAAITEGHKAEQMRPNEPLVHTNLSLFYMKAGDKQKAEHHGMQARIASWRGNMAPPDPNAAKDELEIAAPPPPKPPPKLPETPWKKQPPKE